MRRPIRAYDHDSGERRPGTRRLSGSALLVTLGLLAAITLSVSVFLSAINQAMTQTSLHQRDRECAYLAEAGTEKAVAELRDTSGTYTGESDTPLGPGKFSVAVTRGEREGQYHVVSTGELRNNETALARSRVEAEVEIAADGTVRLLHWVKVARK